MRVDLGDISLNIEMAGSGEPLVLLHGFTGSAEAWRTHIDMFSQRYRVLAVDHIGHGRSDSPSDPARYRMERCVSDLATVLAQFDVERAHWLGYSMGGRVALALAAAHPGRVRSLVLEGASPGLAGAAERRARAARDEELAARIEAKGIEWFVHFWMRQPLFASQRRCPREVIEQVRKQRLRNSPLGLANSLRGMGTGAQPPLWDRLATIDVPVLLVVGEEDEKFRAIAAEMQRRLPRAEVVAVPRAGHTVHLEQPEPFAECVLAFLEKKGGLEGGYRRKAAHGAPSPPQVTQEGRKTENGMEIPADLHRHPLRNG